jgi:hypothetical protein
MLFFYAYRHMLKGISRESDVLQSAEFCFALRVPNLKLCVVHEFKALSTAVETTCL